MILFTYLPLHGWIKETVTDNLYISPCSKTNTCLWLYNSQVVVQVNKFCGWYLIHLCGVPIIKTLSWLFHKDTIYSMFACLPWICSCYKKSLWCDSDDITTGVLYHSGRGRKWQWAVTCWPVSILNCTALELAGMHFTRLGISYFETRRDHLQLLCPCEKWV